MPRMTGTWMLPIRKSGIGKGIRMSDFGTASLSDLFPLFSLVYPDYCKYFLKVFKLTYQDTGFCMVWLGERGMMPGTLIDGIFTRIAVQKGSHQTYVTCWQLCSAAQTRSTQHFGRHVAMKLQDHLDICR